MILKAMIYYGTKFSNDFPAQRIQTLQHGLRALLVLLSSSPATLVLLLLHKAGLFCVYLARSWQDLNLGCEL